MMRKILCKKKNVFIKICARQNFVQKMLCTQSHNHKWYCVRKMLSKHKITSCDQTLFWYQFAATKLVICLPLANFNNNRYLNSNENSENVDLYNKKDFLQTIIIWFGYSTNKRKEGEKGHVWIDLLNTWTQFFILRFLYLSMVVDQTTKLYTNVRV